MGLPVCAQKATVHPMKLLVSMRLSNSLSNRKSYFYAEINRLRTIMEQLEKAPCFVLLDELLRGTNSEDKQSGTFRIIEKMVALKAIGVIATHDLEVCTLSDKYPDILQNKCFESQIIAGELYFDYTLKEGERAGDGDPLLHPPGKLVKQLYILIIKELWDFRICWGLFCLCLTYSAL